MKRLGAALALGLLLALSPVAAKAQPGKVRRVGFIALRGRAELSTSYFNALASELRELGWIEGKNLVIDWRFADGHYDRLPEIVGDLVRIPVDVLVTEGTPATQAAQKVTRSVPVVFPMVGDPVGNGLVKSLARPGGNTTGISLVVGGTNESAKQIDLLRLMVPHLSRVGVLVNPENPYSAVTLKSLQDAVATMMIEIRPFDVRTPEDVAKAFEVMARDRIGAIILVADSFVTQQRRQIAQLAVRDRLPSLAGLREFVEAGGLMSYGQNRVDNYRRAAGYVDKILRGANPGDLPVQQPMTLELFINRKTAKAFRLEIPPELLVLADRVIE